MSEKANYIEELKENPELLKILPKEYPSISQKMKL
jgi:hypothetical protein